MRASMDGVADSFYGGDPRRSVDENIGAIYRTAGNRFSWELAWVAEVQGQPVAMAPC
jgi:hypothetical protein